MDRVVVGRVVDALEHVERALHVFPVGIASREQITAVGLDQESLMPGAAMEETEQR